MKLGKLERNSRGWFWDGMQLQHPTRILWNLAIAPVYFVVLFFFCIVRFAVTLDISDFRDTWKTNNLV